MHTETLSLHHIVRPSSLTNASAPALFMLHGYGSNEEDLFSFANELPEEYFIISVRAPYPLPPYGNAWYSINFDATYGKWSNDEEALLSKDKIVQFIDEACMAYNLDKNKIDLLGFSQGTILCYALALSHPGRIRNLVGLSGYINENILPADYSKNKFEKLAIYASHGQVDQVIPIEWAQRSMALLQALKVDYTFTEFPIGHGVSQENFNSFKTWLQRRL